MKNYSVRITHPAVANLLVEANTTEEAVDKARIMLAYGAGVEFEVNIEDPTKVSISASEHDSDKAAEAQGSDTGNLKEYIVALDAVSHKEVPLHAVSPEAAIALAREMYFRTGALDFSDGDVERVTATIVEDAPSENGLEDLKLRLFTELVKEIRNNPAADEVVAGILREGVDEIIGAWE